MININIIKENDAVRAVIATGHSREGKRAQHICNGVSALMYTLVLSLKEVNKVGISVIDDKEGMSVEILKGYHKKEVQVILNTILCGLKGISNLYPQNVKIRSN